MQKINIFDEFRFSHNFAKVVMMILLRQAIHQIAVDHLEERSQLATVHLSITTNQPANQPSQN